MTTPRRTLLNLSLGLAILAGWPCPCPVEAHGGEPAAPAKGHDCCPKDPAPDGPATKDACAHCVTQLAPGAAVQAVPAAQGVAVAAVADPPDGILTAATLRSEPRSAWPPGPALYSLNCAFRI